MTLMILGGPLTLDAYSQHQLTLLAALNDNLALMAEVLTEVRYQLAIKAAQARG